jgi:AraC family transcriptional regulator
MTARLPSGVFAGKVQGTRTVSGLLLAETEYEPAAHVPVHAHDHGLCSLVLDGSFTERRGRRDADCARGSLIYQPRDEPHAHAFGSSGGRCFTVQFGTDWIARLTALGLGHPSSPAALHRTRAAWIAQQLYGEFRTEDAASQLAIEGLALTLLGELERAAVRRERGPGVPRWLASALERLTAAGGGAVSVTQLAIDLEVDPNHLARTFKRHHGCTMTEFVRRQRIDLAKRLLLRGAMPLSQVALEAGFADQAHFTRVFRRVTGSTPAAFRRAVTGR